MACHEIAALRLGMMNVLGIDDPAERQHELAEMGGALEQSGPLRSLTLAKDVKGVLRFYESALVRLEETVASRKPEDPKLPYLRSLLVLTKKVEMELRREADSLERLYRELERIHDFTHEIYPAD